MKFTALKDELKKNFQLCAKTADSRGLQPVLENVILKAGEDNVITLMSTNTEISTLITMKADVSEPGITSISAKIGSEILNSISWNKDENIDFSIEEDRLNMTSGDSNFSIPVISYEAYPEINPVSEGSSFKIGFNHLKNAVKCVKSAVSKDFLKENLKGIYVETENENSFNFVATDSRRLAFKRESIVSMKMLDGARNILIPGVVMDDVAGISEDIQDVLCIFDRKHISFYLNNIVITASLVEAQFPNYKMVIPQETKLTVRVDRVLFNNSLKAVMPVARLENNSVEISLTKNCIHLQASSPDAGVATQKINLEHEVEGEVEDNFRIKFNIKYLADAVASVEGNDIEIKLIDPTSQAIIKEIDRTDYFSIIMPIKLY